MELALGAPQRERELEFTERDFQRIRNLIADRAGIVLAEHKRDMVYSRLGRCVRSRGLVRFGDYLSLLTANNASRDWQEFVNALTTNLTAFFRESHHFQLLQAHFQHRREPVRIWSAGASTGEEPYSIVMTLEETLGGAVPVEVLATDIDSEALERARKGVYPLEQVRRQLNDERIHRFFLKGSGQKSGLVRVRPEIARRVTFRQLNFVGTHWPLQQQFDVIFCRNVMIYFDRETQVRLLERFASLLRNDGLLFVGHSENFSHLTQRFRLRGQTVYTLS